MRIENNMGKKLHDIKDVTEKLGFKKSKNFFFTKDNMERMKKAATDKKKSAKKYTFDKLLFSNMYNESLKAQQ